MHLRAEIQLSRKPKDNLMNGLRSEKSLMELVVSHTNDYGFDIPYILQKPSHHLPGLSVVIPFYEGAYLALVLRYLYRGLGYIRRIYNDWQFEVIVIDDGSKQKASNSVTGCSYENLSFIVFEENQGRTEARNAGLRKAKFEKVLFLDADVLVSEGLILDHLKVHAFSHSKKFVTVGFFAFIEEEDELLSQSVVDDQDIKSRLNDFRLSCVYQSTWIGCKKDKKFVGKKLEIVSETWGFRNWPKDGYFGPWLLTNMVLGGFFMVDRWDSLSVNGFDASFRGYGFTETSLPTKLIAAYGHYIVPVVENGCIHIEDKKANLARSEKDRAFRIKHEYYFNNYLKRTLDYAIYGN